MQISFPGNRVRQEMVERKLEGLVEDVLHRRVSFSNPYKVIMELAATLVSTFNRCIKKEII